MNLELGLTKEIIAECKKQKLNLWECAYVLATAYWETAKTMLPVEEGFYLKNPKAHQKKLEYYPYYGRGLVQLTWLNNYKKAGDFLGIDLVKNPNLALDNKVSVTVLVTGMRKGWFTGVQLDDNIDAIDEADSEDSREFQAARKGVNGTDRKAEIAQLALQYERDLKDAGYNKQSSGKPEDVPEQQHSKQFNLLELIVRFIAIIFKAWRR